MQPNLLAGDMRNVRLGAEQTRSDLDTLSCPCILGYRELVFLLQGMQIGCWSSHPSQVVQQWKIDHAPCACHRLPCTDVAFSTCSPPSNTPCAGSSATTCTVLGTLLLTCALPQLVTPTKLREICKQQSGGCATDRCNRIVTKLEHAEFTQPQRAELTQPQHAELSRPERSDTGLPQFEGV